MSPSKKEPAEQAPPIAPATGAPRVERVAVASLKPHSKNYRRHPADQLAHIVESIKQNGYYRNIVLASDYTILAGHGVVLAAEQIGDTHVPAICLDIPPESPQALKILAGDNEISRLGEIDDRALTNLLGEVLEADWNGLLGTGFDADMLAAYTMLTRPQSEIESADASLAWVGLPAFEPKEAPLKIVVSCETETDRANFMQLIGATIVQYKLGTVWSLWWPQKEREDPSSLRFEAEHEPSA
ncbi:MAG: ParB N-terminal domain-containing protein [Gemmatimonas sp.]